MKLLILTVFSAIGAMTDIVVDSGQPLTITCAYNGIYIDITKQVSENGKKTSNLLFLRINESPPNEIQSGKTVRPWRYDQSNSFYESGNTTENKFSITLAQADFEDEGIYLCKNVVKQVTTSFRVTVNSPPRSKTTFSSNISAEDEMNSFYVGKCEASYAKPEAQIFWEDGEGNRVENAKYKTTTRGKTHDSISYLNIVRIDKNIHHQQKYRCVVIQNGEKVYTSNYSAPINVQWKPERTEIRTEGTRSENATEWDVGTDVKMICSSDANPAPKMTWSILDTEQNRTIEDLEHWIQEEFDLNSAVLSTSSLVPSDGQVTFVCSASNLHGEQSYQVTLDIKELPPSSAGPMGLLWALLGVIAVVLAVAVCMLMNRWIQRRRSGIYKTETNHRDGSCDSLNDELQAAAKKEYFM